MTEHNHDSDTEVRYVVHHEKWWEKWVNPTTIMALLGAVFWGFQLHFMTLHNIDTTSELAQTQKELVTALKRQELAHVRTVVLIDELEKRVNRLEGYNGIADH